MQRQTLITGSARGREEAQYLDVNDVRNKRARQDPSDGQVVADSAGEGSDGEEDDEPEEAWNPGASDVPHNSTALGSAELASDEEGSEDEDFELPDIDTGADPDIK